MEDGNRDLTAESAKNSEIKRHTHFSTIGNAKRKRTQKCGFTGVFERFGGDDGKRPAFMD
jgi:hypothetical protein